jgi:phage regulator Rha-like protein
MSELLRVSTVPTMSSREIAELVDSRHDSVKRTIERCAESGVFTLPPLVETSFKGVDGRGQTVSVYHLDKRSSLIVVAQLSPEYTARIVDRWQELETTVQAPLRLSVTSQAAAAVEDTMRVAALFGVPTHYAQAEAVKLARNLTGVDFTPLLPYSPAQDDIAEEDLMLEPTELGRLVGLSAVKTNDRLYDLGLQFSKNKTWYPTAKGSALCATHHWAKNGKTGYNLKWRVAAVAPLLREAA